jgi:nucleoid-associated protein EbfC
MPTRCSTTLVKEYDRNMNQAQLMAQVKKMQAEMTKAQDELAATVVSGSAAGGAVTVEMTCDTRVKSVKLTKEAVDPDDVETLEDLVVVAVNDALTKANDVSQKRMASVTGGMHIPGFS